MRRVHLILASITIASSSACTPTQHASTGPASSTVRRVAERRTVYTVDDLISSGYARAGSLNLAQVPPFYVLVADDESSCVVSEQTYAAVAIGSSYSCHWVRPRRNH